MKLMLMMKCETPLHMGSGTEIGSVDMPIQREKHTGFPKMEASGIKGVLSSQVKDESKGVIFGEENGQDGAGNLQISDGKILFLPVRVNRGIFIWVTCPYVLSQAMGHYRENTEKFESDGQAISDNEIYLLTEKKEPEENLIVEDYNMKIRKINQLPSTVLNHIGALSREPYITGKLKNDLYLVSDQVFSYFCEFGTEVATRIRINEDGIVKDGALFTEEFLPEQTILYTVLDNLSENKVVDDYIKNFKEQQYIQFGANASLGKGIVSMIGAEVNRVGS